MLQILVNFASSNSTQLWSIGTVILGTVIARVFRLRPKLQYSIGHAANLLVETPAVDPEGNQITERRVVQTASIFVQNAGLQPARSAQLTFNWKPQIVNVMPPRAYDEATHAFDRYTVTFESLAPGEAVTIEIMSLDAGLPQLTAVRSDESVAKQFPMAPQRVWPTWFTRVLGALLFLGAITAVYLVAELIQLIAS